MKGEFREHREADDSSWCLHGYRINVPSLMRGALGILQHERERLIVPEFVARFFCITRVQYQYEKIYRLYFEKKIPIKKYTGWFTMQQATCVSTSVS